MVTHLFSLCALSPLLSTSLTLLPFFTYTFIVLHSLFSSSSASKELGVKGKALEDAKSEIETLKKMLAEAQTARELDAKKAQKAIEEREREKLTVESKIQLLEASFKESGGDKEAKKEELQPSPAVPTVPTVSTVSTPSIAQLLPEQKEPAPPATRPSSAGLTNRRQTKELVSSSSSGTTNGATAEGGKEPWNDDNTVSPVSGGRRVSGTVRTQSAGGTNTSRPKVSKDKSKREGKEVLLAEREVYQPIIATSPTSTSATPSKDTSNKSTANTSSGTSSSSIDWTSAPLPSGWERAVDPVSGKVYYKNHINKVTSWHHPQQPRR